MALKPGDRIRVYGHGPDLTHVFDRTIVSINDEGYIETDGGENCHPKQCRKLVRKERRRILVNINQSGGISGVCFKGKVKIESLLGDFYSDNDTVEFIEMKRK